MAVYFAMLKPGETIMSMDLSMAGILRKPRELFGKLFNIVPYGVSKGTRTIDYDELSESLQKNSQNDCQAKVHIPCELDFKRLEDC
jgi:glycine hydroxymethyltransferase